MWECSGSPSRARVARRAMRARSFLILCTGPFRVDQELSSDLLPVDEPEPEGKK